MQKNKKIKCNVSNCKYNNIKKCECDLNEIKVSCNCKACDCHDKAETICDSFQENENE